MFFLEKYPLSGNTASLKLEVLSERVNFYSI